MTTTKTRKKESFELHLPKETKSLNKTLKEHWSVRIKDKEDWQLLLGLEFTAGPIWVRKKFDHQTWLSLKKRITITRIMGPKQRPFDHDNLVGGCKQLIDAMKGILIKDDTAEYLQATYKQVKGERAGTVIGIRWS